MVLVFGSAVETSLVSCTPIAAAVARPAAAAEPTDAAPGPKAPDPAAPPVPDLASAPPWEAEGFGCRVLSAASTTTVVIDTTVAAAQDLLWGARLAVQLRDGPVEGALGILFQADRVLHVEPDKADEPVGQIRGEYGHQYQHHPGQRSLMEHSSPLMGAVT